MLSRVRTGECTDDDIDLLETRVIAPDTPNYPTHALHVYRLNDALDKRNVHMLNSLASENDQYTFNACDSVAGHIDLSNLSDRRSETGNLHRVLKIAVGAGVMLTVNVNVSDGLVNGARGEIVHIVTGASRKVNKILVKFDDPNVGLQAIHLVNIVTDTAMQYL